MGEEPGGRGQIVAWRKFPAKSKFVIALTKIVG